MGWRAAPEWEDEAGLRGGIGAGGGRRAPIFSTPDRGRAPPDRPGWDGLSVDQVVDDAGQIGAGVGEAIEVVLTLAPGGDDAAVPEQRQVVADGGLALAELGAEGADVLLALGEDQDDLQAGRVADVLQQD